MSATQPLIFTPDEEIVELIPDCKQYFRLFNRTKLINRTKIPIKFDDFCLEIQRYHEKNAKNNILIILNTKAKTRECFVNLCKLIPENRANLYFLSTYITPYERKIIINRIKRKCNKLPNIVISTQLIEAGVDISVQTVFRALAPMDSIIQASGRANRYYESGVLGSEVFLYEIEELKSASSLIYGPELLQKTKQVLENVDVVEESRYLDLIANYFKKVRVQSDNIESELLKNVCNLDFEKVGKFSFIEERKTESVFVQLNEEAKAVWEQYVAIVTDQTMKGWDRKANFAKIKGKFYDFVINVGVDFGKQNIEFESEQEHFFYVSKLENPSKCYLFDYNMNGDNFRLNQGYIPSKQISIFG
jgi:CRISPR-associated endonuclease/helicase Cas3